MSSHVTHSTLWRARPDARRNVLCVSEGLVVGRWESPGEGPVIPRGFFWTGPEGSAGAETADPSSLDADGAPRDDFTHLTENAFSFR